MSVKVVFSDIVQKICSTAPFRGLFHGPTRRAMDNRLEFISLNDGGEGLVAHTPFGTLPILGFVSLDYLESFLAAGREFCQKRRSETGRLTEVEFKASGWLLGQVFTGEVTI